MMRYLKQFKTVLELKALWMNKQDSCRLLWMAGVLFIMV